MRVTDYSDFVRKTTQFAEKGGDEKRAIAFYGLVSEIGSLVAAVKKKLLREGGETAWNQANDEIKEELGDAIWYCFASGLIVNDDPFDILANDIRLLREEISSSDERARNIAVALDKKAKQSFLEASASFPPNADYMFDDYQQLAFKTARTDGRVLLEVCVAVLWQLGAELLRPTLPDIEIKLNKNIADRPTNVILGEIVWHLSALASLYNLALNDVIEANCQKVRFRSERGKPTLLHDTDREADEQFPRVFDVSFVRIGHRHSRMYFDGKSLGDDLTDNFHSDDGYRFHDVIHLALIAHLGWSPVFRGLMKRKRKRKNADDRVDEVEDGGRAKVVEELLIKAIHSEGNKQANADGRCIVGEVTRLFPQRRLITFRILKTLRLYVDGLEVERNSFWEWEDAIFHGCEMFFHLINEKQGTVRVDLGRRRLSFDPNVSPGVQGIVAGIGMASIPAGFSVDQAKALSPDELEWAQQRGHLLETIAAKHALVRALGLSAEASEILLQVEVRLDGLNRIYVKSAGAVQYRAWGLKAIDYKVAFARSHDHVICTVNAVA